MPEVIKPKATLFGNITLGQFIEALEQTATSEESGKTVGFDFCGFEPTTLGSYRGFYDHCDLGYKTEAYSQRKLSDLIDYLKSMVGKDVESWKGGPYTVNLDRPMWVALAGECFGTGIVGVKDDKYQTIILTEYLDV